MDIPDHLAITIYDLVNSMTHPTSRRSMRHSFRAAYWLKGQLEDIYAEAGVDPAEVERPEVPPVLPPDWAEMEMEHED